MGRLRIAVGDRELEVEGDVEFLSQYATHIDAMLAALASPDLVPTGARPDASAPRADSGPAYFGELLQRLPRTASGNDTMLAAAWWVQQESDDKTFTTAAAADLLEEQGIKLANPSNAIARNKSARRVFAVGKGKFRISQQGEERLRLLTEADSGARGAATEL